MIWAVPDQKIPPAFPAPPLKNKGKGEFDDGFTLVEVIITILAAGILGAIFINFMGTAMSRSTRSIENVQNESSAEAIIERIIADYVSEINKADPSLALGTIKARNYGTKVSMVYIDFNLSGNEQVLSPPNTSDTLKIMVEASGNNLTTLLTNSRISVSPSDPTYPPVEF